MLIFSYYRLVCIIADTSMLGSLQDLYVAVMGVIGVSKEYVNRKVDGNEGQYRPRSILL